MVNILFIYLLVVFGHVTGFLPIKPLQTLSTKLAFLKLKTLSKFINKMSSCSVCQCHAIGLIYLVISGRLVENMWLYIGLLTMSYLTMPGITFLRSLYNLLMKWNTIFYKWTE